AAPPPPSPAPETPKARRRFDLSVFRRRFDMSVFRRSGRFGALTALAVAALLFGAWFGYQGWKDMRTDVVTTHEEAADTAASSAETIFTYQYDKLDEYVEDAQDTMTPSFAEKFKTISPALNDLAPQRKIQVKASTRDAAALECGNTCSEDKARILVFVDQARLADGSDKPTVFGNRVELEMVNRDGTWLVDDIKAL
ncbi:hypothetical protein, partial [Aeromicrobium sp.]|uniref:hypothetical protein n=1 Tax=Aeromicrobium sp. TaxID=1871063 RepID=UPI003D6AED8D